MKNFDTSTSFSIKNSAIMGRLVRLDGLINSIIEKHNYPLDVSGVVAEGAALAALLSSTIKFDDSFILQTQTNGAVPMLVADISVDNAIRACASFDEKKVQKIRNPNQKYKLADDELLETPHWLGNGHLAFTVDPDKKTFYQGVVELKGKNLSECALKYFKESEQIDTYLQLFLNHQDGHWQSAGILLQRLPSDNKISIDDNEWNEAVIFAQSLQKTEIFDHSLSDETLLTRLFHEQGLKITSKKQYHFSCRCSREKLLETLRAFKPEDLDSMCKNNQIIANCNFCSEQYVFNKGELINQ